MMRKLRYNWENGWIHNEEGEKVGEIYPKVLGETVIEYYNRHIEVSDWHLQASKEYEDMFNKYEQMKKEEYEGRVNFANIRDILAVHKTVLTDILKNYECGEEVDNMIKNLLSLK